MILGVKASPSDAPRMAVLQGVGFLETVLWGEDLMDRYDQSRDAFSSYDVHVVHAPFTVPGGAEVDVAHADPAHRDASIRMWRLSLRLAEDLGARWVVVHPGGIVPTDAASGGQGGVLRTRALERTTEALRALAQEGGEERVLVENMPSHYHRADGTTQSIITGQGIMDFFGWSDHTAGLCLDTSHAVLTPGGMKTLETFLRRGARVIRHVHLGDAVPPDGEGVQLGRGVVDWQRVGELLREVDAVQGGITAVPEIRGGHQGGAEGFQKALDFAHARL